MIAYYFKCAIKTLTQPIDSAYAEHIYSVDLEVWSNLAKRALIKCTASKCARDFDCDWQRVNAFSHCVTLTRIPLPQIISYSDTKVPVLVVMECKRASVLYAQRLIFLLHTSRSTQYRQWNKLNNYYSPNQMRTYQMSELGTRWPSIKVGIHKLQYT